MSEQPIDPNMTINEFIAKNPSAIGVLNAFGIDTCCGGADSLAEAAERHGIDPESLLLALAAATAGEVEAR